MKKLLFSNRILVAACYSAAVLVYLMVCLVGYLGYNAKIADGSLAPQALALEDFVLESALQLEDDDGRQLFVSTDPDPHLVYNTGGAFPVSRFVFAATPLKPGGEIALYYSTRPDGGFTEKEKLWALQAADGSWYFDLDGRAVTALRLDPDTTGGVLWTVDSITLNALKPAAEWFVPDARQVFLLLFAPGLVAAFVAAARNGLSFKSTT